MSNYIVAVEGYVDVEANSPMEALEIVWKNVKNIESDKLSVQQKTWYSVQDESGDELMSEQIG